MVNPLSPPNGQLAAELEQVAADAVLLVDYLENANDIFPPFPKDELEEIAEQLIYLGDGTSRGAAMVLWYSSKRLPSLRREYLRYETLSQEEGDRSYQVRGMSLDHRLVALIASVGTALDECRAQDAIETDTEPEREIRISTERVAEEGVPIRRGTLDLSEDATKAAHELNLIKIPTSKRADELSRGLADLHRLGQIAATELSFRTIVWNWLQRVGARIADYPGWLEIAGRAIQKGADIAELTWLRWDRLRHEILGLVIKEARETGYDIERLARTWQTVTDAEISEQVGDPNASANDAFMGANLADIDRQVRMRLMQAPGDAKSSRLRAVRELIANDLSHPDAVLALAERAATDPSKEIQHTSATALMTETGGGIQSSVIRDLIRRYEELPPGPAADAIVRFFSMYSPSVEGIDNQFKFLLKLVELGPGASAFPYAMQGLLNHFGDRPEVMLAAEKTIKKARSSRAQSMTLVALTKAHPGSPHTQAMLSWALSECDERDLKLRALRLVSRKPEWGSWTMPLMLDLRRNHRDPRVSREATRSLEAIGWTEQDANDPFADDGIAEWRGK